MPEAHLSRAVEAAFAGDPRPNGVGVELELVPYRVIGRRAGPPRVADLAPFLQGLPAVSFEPGGQVELSPGPRSSVREILRDVDELRAQVEKQLAAAGVAVHAVGSNERHSVAALGLQLQSRRYREMDAWFALRGDSGAHFMRRTAGLQVCVRLLPGSEGRAQWCAALAAAPVLAAIFRNSRDGERVATWCDLDLTRTGRDRLGRTGRHPVEEYVAFAAAAPPLSSSYAGPDNVHEHLSTLFPAVRPRGRYLELRAVDSVDGQDLADAVALAVLITAAPQPAAEAAEILEPLHERDVWRLAAGPGIAHPLLRTAAQGLIQLGLRALPDLPAELLPRDTADRLRELSDRVDEGCTPYLRRLERRRARRSA